MAPKNIPCVCFEVSVDVCESGGDCTWDFLIIVGPEIVGGLWGIFLPHLNFNFLDIVQKHVFLPHMIFYVIWQWIKCSICWNGYDIMLNREGVFHTVINALYTSLVSSMPNNTT